MALTVNLIGPSPWGFRILGGRDFKKAITVSKVTGASKADQADLQPGDIILAINGKNTADMLNVEAQNTIKNSKTQLQLVVERPEPPSSGRTNGISTPEQLTGRFQEAVIVSRDENQNYKEYTISSPASPGPYSQDPFISQGVKRESLTPSPNKSVLLRPWSPEEKSHRLSRPLSQEFSPSDYRSNSVSSRTPTPPGRYSPHSPIDQDVPMSPRRSSSSDSAMQKFDRESEVYKMIQENKESRTAPRQSNTFKMLQEVLEADEKEAAQKFPGLLSPNSPIQSVGGVKKNHTCEKCGTGILTLAVRIADDRYRHSECYTCTDCGLNLKMRGHFCVGDVMYCEKHAKQRYQGPGSSPQATVSPRQ
ncbi:PDZ and LIM domain protein 2 isoform X2 [Gasterosteus aculeatus]|uniref:PDZ and LIM domain protein 2 n=1 Tax=Gasterosteus aculeatus aculeatus TaxID=481459 RepID=G3PAK7_GASAC|nr:PDZ and LIM domain protein 2 isoform X2 [Gasterosteus aculeatus aculeatus]